jgi:hypothetical protein
MTNPWSFIGRLLMAAPGGGALATCADRFRHCPRAGESASGRDRPAKDEGAGGGAANDKGPAEPGLFR